MKFTYSASITLALCLSGVMSHGIPPWGDGHPNGPPGHRPHDGWGPPWSNPNFPGSQSSRFGPSGILPGPPMPTATGGRAVPRAAFFLPRKPTTLETVVQGDDSSSSSSSSVPPFSSSAPPEPIHTDDGGGGANGGNPCSDDSQCVCAQVANVNEPMQPKCNIGPGHSSGICECRLASQMEA
ncbi:hypothetical protein F5X99DRAFT_414113 [Biscogniauxia marginata]|nr:hypothetical protein F5X99DRAFT_414113 [Biscogniauxia marginata]